MRHFVDTSAWIAFVDKKDPDHAAVKRALNANRGELVTTTYVLDETVTLAKRRLGANVAILLGNHLRGSPGITVVHVAEQDEQEAWNLFCKRADKGCGFTNCTSFVVMRTLGINAAFALDDDFRQEGFQVKP